MTHQRDVVAYRRHYKVALLGLSCPIGFSSSAAAVVNPSNGPPSLSSFRRRRLLSTPPPCPSSLAFCYSPAYATASSLPIASFPTGADRSSDGFGSNPSLWSRTLLLRGRLTSIPSHVFSLGHVSRLLCSGADVGVVDGCLQLPTPINLWNLPDLPNGTEVWLKRDNLSGMQLRGNKVRKLEFLLADSVSQGSDCVITIGGIQMAAKYLNLDCYLILRTSKALVGNDLGLTGNLLVERLMGAHIDRISKEEYAKIRSVII